MSKTGNAAKGRLEGKVALITGAAGNLGSEISRAFASEGAFVVMTGRTEDRIAAAREQLIKDTGVAPERIDTAVLDGGNPDSIRAAMAKLRKEYGRIDILINNAGSAGPKQPLHNVPLSAQEMEACGDTETVRDAMLNILGVTWNMARIVAPMMPVGGAMVNISTIFSHTRYYGRTAYVVPKAALNALSNQLAGELGPRGIRVNTVFPGPIESDRIRTVFAAMDEVQNQPKDTTADYFTGRMALTRSVNGKVDGKPLPNPKDIAGTCLFLASEEAAGIAGEEVDVTHGLSANRMSASTYMTRPSMRSLDGAGLNIFIVSGENWDDALVAAHTLIGSGARVRIGLARNADVAQANARLKAQGVGDELTVTRFNRSEPDAMEDALAAFSGDVDGAITGAIILPVKPSGHFTGSLLAADDETVIKFMDTELVGAIAASRSFARYWHGREDLQSPPRCVFMTNPGDPLGNSFASVLSAGITQLIRIWRDEERVQAGNGSTQHAVWSNQIIRHTNTEDENTRFAAGHATRVLFREQRIAEIDLKLPANISEETGSRKAMVGFAENITGLHLGKVAFITGGSAGIGGQVARLLALAGAKVMMVARRESELVAARDRIVGELQDIGFAGVERRVKYMADIDVSDFASLDKAVDATLQEFGRIDYLINNAGVAGAEDMVIDMEPEAWRFTLDANLISNYHLMQRVVPLMKSQGSGYVLNVSSYFGGEKFLAVAYPNRADYGLSKAGQRAMVEAFSPFLGPEVQCNAIAPGPVDGDRLSGTGGKPGLFQRRARLILENKRLNAVYSAVIHAIREGGDAAKILTRLSRNSTSTLSHDAEAPEELRKLALDFASEGDGLCTWDQYLLTEAMAQRLLVRLQLGGFLLGSNEWASKSSGDATWLKLSPPEDKPFLPAAQVDKVASGVGKGVISQLHLGAMPTEAEVAQATVFFLADRAVSGETFMPSGGLRVERSNTEREMFGSPKQERIDKMKGKTVWIIGEHLSDYVAATIDELVSGCGVAKVVLIAKDKTGEKAVRDLLPGDLSKDALEVLIAGDGIEEAMDEALGNWGKPTTVLSMPGEPLPDHLFEDGNPLSTSEFAQMVEANITRHYRVTRKASLYDGCQVVLVSPDVPYGSDGPGVALANFVKTSLHAFTATVAVENERLVHDVPVNQINLTRRVSSEEPRDADEHAEELRRFTRAVLLVGAPLPDAQDSRYRSKIYRGTSMTV
ncbi:NAD-dependent dehydratase [Erythrobacter sp. KY5]|uniref:SDR family NAD(P)-dependent oxidoreductase n=1 Tax=Erythrobacter sp. KY5 TaxID=2011159 RepID=UPI000DBF32D0|nr:SDR family NAD(P)-dependent oxidoreductase [Erythrobacter sp. KY5]AWW74329.1 NAD-dependent dehydratase [Erythrobacter sp. KY5]